MAIERLERGRLSVGGSLLPTPREQTNPCERQGPHGGLRGFPRVALLLGIDPCPEGMPARFRRPLHNRLSEAGRALQAPVDPRLFAAALGHWCAPGILLECCGGGITCTWLAKGDQEAGSEARSGPWKGLEEGKVGMVLGALGAGGVKGLDGVPGDTERAAPGLDEPGMGGDDAVIGGQGHGGLDSVDTRVDAGRRAHMGVAEDGCQGGAARALCGFEGGPAPEKVTNDEGVFLRNPVPHLRARVLQGPGEAMGEPPFLPDHAATVCDELGEGAHGRTLRLERRPRVARGEEQCELEGSVRGVVCGPAGGAGFAVPGHRHRIAGKEPQEVILAQGGDHGPFVALAADSHRLAVEARAEHPAPRVAGLGRVRKPAGLTFLRASSLPFAQIWRYIPDCVQL
jgi:hypothetical protein